MRYPNNLPVTDLLINALLARGGKDVAEDLSVLYQMKGKAFASFANKDQYVKKEILKIEKNLAELLKPAITEDETIFGKKSDVNYIINGNLIPAKVDTGAVGSVVDARDIVWKGADLEFLTKLHEEYAEEHPTASILTREKLEKFKPEYKDLDFGYVESFRLATHNTKKEEDYTDVEIQGHLKVESLSNPTNTSGKRKGLRPVVTLDAKREGSEEIIKFPFGLTDRPNMTKRMLIGKDFLSEADAIIAYDERDTRKIDLKKLDISKVQQIILPVLSL